MRIYHGNKEALTCSGLGSRVRGTREVRGNYKKPPHLLVVSAGKSFDHVPARSGRRPSGGKIAPHPPTQVSFDAARSDGLKNSKRTSVEEGSTANEAARRDA